MSLDEALVVVCSVHTQDDEQIGFTICREADAPFDDLLAYWQAWNTIRAHIGARTAVHHQSVPVEKLKLQIVAADGRLKMPGSE